MGLSPASANCWVANETLEDYALRYTPRHGFSNALWAILVVGLITFLTGLPISYYAANYGLDMTC